MNTKHLIKQGVLGLCGAAALAMGLMLDIQPAAAHGERSQEPFLRMRTIQWYDMKWQPETTKVNDLASMTGKFHLAEDWPRAVGKPGRAFFNVGSPSPVFVRLSTKLNGEPTMIWVRLRSVATTPLKRNSKRGFRDAITCTPWSTSRMQARLQALPPG